MFQLNSLLYYAPKKCAWCDSTGIYDGKDCPCCKAKGYVLAGSPSLVCPTCKGTGKAVSLCYSTITERCLVCLGSGWMAHARPMAIPKPLLR